MDTPISHELAKTLSVSDELAIKRSIMANERTLLAYVRTFLSFYVAGASFIKFFQYRWMIISGYVLIPLGILILLIGLRNYWMIRCSILRIGSEKNHA